MRRRPDVKWPQGVQRKEWEAIDNDLIEIFEQQMGTTEKKLERMGNVIYHSGMEVFGVNKGKSKNSSSQVQETKGV